MSNFNTVLYSHWRSGSNLFASIFVERLRYNYLDDYFQQLSFEKIFTQREQSYKESYLTTLNHYLSQIADKSLVKNNLLKLMPPDLAVVDNSILENLFPYKVLLYRNDFFNTVKSYAVAEKTKVYFSAKEKNQFNDELNIKFFQDTCVAVLENLKTLMSYNPKVDFIFEYETDLIPYIKNYPTTWKKQITALVNNEEELKEIYLNTFKDSLNELNDYFLNKRLKSMLPIDIFFESLIFDMNFFLEKHPIK